MICSKNCKQRTHLYITSIREITRSALKQLENLLDFMPKSTPAWGQNARKQLPKIRRTQNNNSLYIPAKVTASQLVEGGWGGSGSSSLLTWRSLSCLTTLTATTCNVNIQLIKYYGELEIFSIICITHAKGCEFSMIHSMISWNL